MHLRPALRLSEFRLQHRAQREAAISQAGLSFQFRFLSVRPPVSPVASSSICRLSTTTIFEYFAIVFHAASTCRTRKSGWLFETKHQDATTIFVGNVVTKAPRLPEGFETDFDKDGWRH